MVFRYSSRPFSAPFYCSIPPSSLTKAVNIFLNMTDSIYLNDMQPQIMEVKKVESASQIPTKASLDFPRDVISPSTVNEDAVMNLPSETEYPTGIRFAILTVSLMLMVFMVALDTTIMGTFSHLLR